MQIYGEARCLREVCLCLCTVKPYSKTYCLASRLRAAIILTQICSALEHSFERVKTMHTDPRDTGRLRYLLNLAKRYCVFRMRVHV